MRGLFGGLGGAAAVALGLLTTTAGRAQEKLPQPVKPAARETVAPGGVHRMVIRNGATQTVHYVAGRDVSPGDAATLRDLEGAENEAMYAMDLQRLKAQYVASERLLEPERRFIQMALYGQNINVATTDGYVGFFGGGYGGAGFRFAGGYPNYAYGAYPYGGLGGGVAFSGGRSVDVNRSLANGMGDEGVLKNTLSQVIAAEATPHAMATAMRNYNAALARAGESNTLRTALGLPAGKAGAPGTARYAADETTAPVDLTLKNGQTIEGSKIVDEKGDYYVIETPTRKVRVLKERSHPGRRGQARRQAGQRVNTRGVAGRQHSCKPR
jgi:hypothetical protein